MKKLYRIFFFVAVFVICISLTVFSVGAVDYDIVGFDGPVHVKRPIDYPFELQPDTGGDYLVTMDVADSVYWERYLSGEVRYTHSGSSWDDESSQQRLLDNIFYVIYPFGEDNFVNFIFSASNIVVNLDLDIDSISKPSVSFDMKVTLCYRATAPNSTRPSAIVKVGSTTVSYQSGVSSYAFNLIDTGFAPGVDGPEMLESPVQYYVIFEFLNVSDQSVTDQITYDISLDGTVSFLVDSTYGEYLQNWKDKNSVNDSLGGINDSIGDVNDKLDGIDDAIGDTNNKLDGIDDAIGDTNNKLDGIDDAIGDTNNKLDGVNDAIGDTNDKLDGVNDAIGDTNNKLDDIMNDDVSPDAPDGSGDIEDTLEAEDSLFSTFFDKYEEYFYIIEDASSLAKTYFPALVVVGRIMTSFINQTFLRALLHISLCLGVLPLILNIGGAMTKSFGKGKGKT